MEMTVVDAGDHTSHIVLSGRLDPHASRQIRDRLRAETVERGRPAVLDLTDVSFITSVGIGLLIDCAESLRKTGHPIVFVKPSGHVDDVFRKTGIYAVVATEDTAEAALARVNGS